MMMPGLFIRGLLTSLTTSSSLILLLRQRRFMTRPTVQRKTPKRRLLILQKLTSAKRRKMSAKSRRRRRRKLLSKLLFHKCPFQPPMKGETLLGFLCKRTSKTKFSIPFKRAKFECWFFFLCGPERGIDCEFL